MLAHCWIVHDGRVILNPPPPEILPVFVLKSDGSALPLKNAA
jgi:hypothetical protein